MLNLLFYFSKKLDIALQIISELKHLEGLRFDIVGTGYEKEVSKYMDLAGELGLGDICEWHGNVSNGKVHEMMRNADVLLFTSIMEATSTVVLESLSNGLPVVCFDICGFGPIIDSNVGATVGYTDNAKSVVLFQQKT